MAESTGRSFLSLPRRALVRRGHGYALALLVGLSLLISYSELKSVSDDSIFLSSDSWDYLSIAQNLHHGNGYKITKGTTLVSQEPTSYRTPGYPAFILAFMKVFGEEKAVTATILYQHFLLALFPLLFYAVSLSIDRDRNAALLAAVMAFLFYPFRALASVIHPELLATFLLMTAAWLLFSYLGKNGTLRILAFSLLLAAAVMVKQNLVALGLVFVFPLPRLAGRWHCLASLGLFVLVISGWVARNYFVQGRFPVFTTNGGLNFFLANNPDVRVDSSNKGQYDGAMNDLMASGSSETAADGKLYRMGFSLARQNGPWWQLKRIAAKAVISSRDYLPPVRNEIFFLLLPFALAAERRRLLLGSLLLFQAVYGVAAHMPAFSLAGLHFANSLDVTAVHVIGALALLLLVGRHDFKAGCLLLLYVLTQILGLVYIPIDREAVIADSMLILAYALSPEALREVYRPGTNHRDDLSAPSGRRLRFEPMAGD